VPSPCHHVPPELIRGQPFEFRLRSAGDWVFESENCGKASMMNPPATGEELTFEDPVRRSGASVFCCVWCLHV
jgi:hypothetical protein